MVWFHLVSRRYLLLQATQQILNGKHAFVQLVHLRHKPKGDHQEVLSSGSRTMFWPTVDATVVRDERVLLQ